MELARKYQVLIRMASEGKIGGGAVQYIDIYNESVNYAVAHTITTRTNSSNQRFVGHFVKWKREETPK